MNRENPNLDSIPSDIFIDIFLRLPTKLVGRCRCVSKLWATLLCRKDFTEVFLTRSSNRPRLLFALERRKGGWVFYSSPHPQNPSGKKTINVAADFHSKIPTSSGKCSYVSGLLCFRDVRISKRKGDQSSVSVILIYNPMTGRYKVLPKLRMDWNPRSFLGFDPIAKQFKVFSITSKTVHILTLGTGNMRWREVQYAFPFTHKPLGEGICINGVLYYLAETTDHNMSYSFVIVCFDVRSEKMSIIKFMDAESFPDKLINCRGQLGMTKLMYPYYNGSGSCDPTCKLCLWVLEDSEKHEWSKSVYEFPVNRYNSHSVIGMTATGDIFLLERSLRPSVVYFNPERNTLERVEIQCVGGYLEVLVKNDNLYTFVDHVEDLGVDDATLLKSSSYDLRIEEDRLIALTNLILFVF